MDGARASDLYPTAAAMRDYQVRYAAVSRRVAVVSIEAFRVGGRGAATGADLGGSSKYSNESFED